MELKLLKSNWARHLPFKLQGYMLALNELLTE